jgi:hypothetical protein
MSTKETREQLRAKAGSRDDPAAEEEKEEEG